MTYDLLTDEVPPFMISPGQSRAARGLLEWSQSNLAEAAGVSLSTVRDFEGGKRTPVPNNLRAMVDAFEKAGIILIPENGEGRGVRLKKEKSE